MKDGFIKVASGTVDVNVADVKGNTEKIISVIKKADEKKVNLLVLPELCLTSYSCEDLFFDDKLISSAMNALEDIRKATVGLYPAVIVGTPLRHVGKLYNGAVVFKGGKVLGAIPKTYLPNYNEFYEHRQFTAGALLAGKKQKIRICGEEVPFGNDLVFLCEDMPEFAFGAEICEDIWAIKTPSTELALAGATIVCNLSASDEVIGKAAYRRMLVASTSSRILSGYVYCNASPTESTQDLVFSRHHIIAENGSIIAENKLFKDCDMTETEIDVFRIVHEREKLNTFTPAFNDSLITFRQEIKETSLTRFIPSRPFVPRKEELRETAEEILDMQALGLKKRIEHSHSETAVLGISGGLDSTLALLATVRAFDMMKKSRKDIICITMPGFGTSNTTKTNAKILCEELGVTLKNIDITLAVMQHFIDIGQKDGVYDITYENAQARERTQILMDVANQSGGLVVGTGDMSELALGWATYNGDHMSMYAVNCGVPKTLVRHVVSYVSSVSEGKLKKVLADIVDTPVSPELLPTDKDGDIAQKTEDIVGPYELHDFFLFNMLRHGYSPAKIYRLAKYAFDGEYSNEVILKWLKVFYRRFFSQQFKRSCLPDGPKIGTVTLSPRGDWRMPSDASSTLWLEEIENLK